MFQVKAPVIIHPTHEVRVALGRAVKEAGLAAWTEIARRGQGVEIAHMQIRLGDVTLAVCSRIRGDGFIVIEIGMGDPRQAARVVTAAQARRDEARSARPRPRYA
jgi:hypothetical protein